jgi:predicted metal-dependent peptidase
MSTNIKEHPKYTEIKVAMIVHVPFFSSLLFDMMDVQVGKFPHIFGGLPPTAATDGRRIYIDEDFLSKLKLPEGVFLVCHEIGHAMWMHMARAKHYKDMGFEGEPFDARRWNYAGDYIINDMLKESGIGEMPQGGLHDRKYTHMMQAEDVYRDLKDKMPPRRTITVSIGQGGMQAEDDGNDGSGMDVHIHAECEINEAEMKRAVQTAVNQAKAMGKCPQALERFAEQFLKPVVSWKERLRYHITRAVARDATTWQTPHRRRLVMQNIYLPSYTGFGAGRIVVVIDTSGSVGPAELNRFFSELDDILITCNPEDVTLIGCDAAVNSVHFLQAGDTLVGQDIKLGGGGGTDFRPPFVWIDEEGMVPAAVIYFTDMYGSFPVLEPAYPVIWCRTTTQDPPWGETIDVNLSEGEEA